MTNIIISKICGSVRIFSSSSCRAEKPLMPFSSRMSSS
jgi:hypothetical protein